MASSKIIDDFPGIYSSAYLIAKPLLNPNLPNLGLNGAYLGIFSKLNVVRFTKETPIHSDIA